MNKTKKLRVPRDWGERSWEQTGNVYVLGANLNWNRMWKLQVVVLALPPPRCSDSGQILLHSECHLSNKGLD